PPPPPRPQQVGPAPVMPARARPGGRPLRRIGDERLIDREAAHIVQEAGELEIVVGIGLPRQLGALERGLELGTDFAPVAGGPRPRQRGEKPLRRQGHARANFWSDRISRGGFSDLPRAVHETSATYRSPRESTKQPCGGVNSP